MIGNLENSSLITVIIPVYNTKKYLHECIDSVLKQTYTNLEIILIDDGSTDGTGDLCDKYVDIDNRIKVFHKPNEGLGLTRNYGIDRTSGEYISFLDSDDKMAYDFLEILYENTVRNNADICKAGHTRFGGGDELKKTVYENVVYNGNQVKESFLPRLIGSSPSHHDSVEMSVWGTLYKTEIIKENNIYFPSERELISEDIVFNTRYFQYVNVGCIIDSTGYYYRVNESSLTRSYRKDRFEAYKNFYTYMTELLRKCGYKDDVLLRLNRYFFVCLRKCIQQESFNRNIQQINNNIFNICSDDLVQKIIEEYPSEKLGYKQRIFLFMIKKKMVIAIKICLKVNVL